jgi:peptidoglycan/xylan/chitin deacetylase (PgdA/CDA1 family)
MPTRDALPKNYIKSNGGAIIPEETFNTAANWNNAYLQNCTVSEDTEHVATGHTKSMRFTWSGSGILDAEIHNFSNISVLDIENMEMMVYSHSAGVTMCDLHIGIRNNTHVNKYSYRAYSVQLFQGWNRVRYLRADRTTGGTPTLRMTFNCLEITVVPQTGTPELSLHVPEINVERTKPSVLITVDDGAIDSYTTIFPILQEYDFKATFYVTKNGLLAGDAEDVRQMSTAQAQEMKAAGHCIANHTATHGGGGDFGAMTYEQAYTDIKDNIDFLLANGFDDGAYHFCYPNGRGSENARLAMAALGIKTGVLIDYELNYPPIDDNKYFLRRSPFSYIASESLGTNKNRLNKAKRMGATLIYMVHYVVENPTKLAEVSISDFRGLCAAIKESGIVPVTIDEWYRGLSNPRAAVSR